MNNMQKTNLETMTIAELKALAYDQIRILQQTQNNITVIEQAILKKQNEQSQKNPKKV